MKLSTNTRTQKQLALQAALSGNPEPLMAYKDNRGRPYTDEELEERRQYLTELCGYEATLKEVIAFFGRFVPTSGNNQCYVLPNGMPLYFHNRG